MKETAEYILLCTTLNFEVKQYRPERDNRMNQSRATEKGNTL
jgi:hypothetical protein